MYHFKFLKKYRTYVPTYKYDFIRFSINSFIFGFFLECYLIFFNRYYHFYKSSFKKELEKVRDYDNNLQDKKRKNMLRQSKIEELRQLEEKLNKLEQKRI
jgi:hypothetical protein